MSKSPKAQRKPRYNPLEFISISKAPLVGLENKSDLKDEAFAVVLWVEENKKSVVSTTKIFTEDKDSSIEINKIYLIKFGSSVYKGKVIHKGKI